MVTRDEIIEVMKGIEDPEVFLDIWFLGLIYRIEVKEELVEIDMTFTSPMCPAGPMLIDQVKTGVEALDGVSEATVQVVFEPPWEPSDDVKALMGMM